jgi:HEAT repeat protein
MWAELATIVVISLTFAGCQKTVDQLIQDLKNEDPKVRRDAVSKLAKQHDARTIDPLIATLNTDTDRHTRLLALLTLRWSSEPRVTEAFFAATSDKDRDIQKYALQALYTRNDPRSIEPLITHLLADLKTAQEERDDNDETIAMQALESMKDPQSVEILLDRMLRGNYSMQLTIEEIIGKIGEPAFEPVLNATKNPKIIIRSAAITALGQFGDPKADAALVAKLKDKTEIDNLRCTAADTLAKKHKGAIEPLNPFLQDPDQQIRLCAVSAIGERIRGEQATEALITALKDRYDKVRMEAAKALGGWHVANRSRGSEALFTAMKNNDLAVMAGAYEYFIYQGEPGTEPFLIRAFSKYGDVRMAEHFFFSRNDRLKAVGERWLALHKGSPVAWSDNSVQYLGMIDKSHDNGPNWGSAKK